MNLLKTFESCVILMLFMPSGQVEPFLPSS